MTGFAATHGVEQFRCNRVLGALAAGKFMDRLVDVIAKIQAAGVKSQMVWAALIIFLIEDGVIEREMAIDTLH